MNQQQWKAGLIVALVAAMTGSVALAAAGATAQAPAKEAVKAGANVLVAGSAIFYAENYQKIISQLKSL